MQNLSRFSSDAIFIILVVEGSDIMYRLRTDVVRDKKNVAYFRPLGAEFKSQISLSVLG